MVLSLVIGFKQENSIGTREDGQAVNLELWAMEKGHAAFALRALLPVFNEVRTSWASVSRKAQG